MTILLSLAFGRSDAQQYHTKPLRQQAPAYSNYGCEVPLVLFQFVQPAVPVLQPSSLTEPQLRALIDAQIRAALGQKVDVKPVESPKVAQAPSPYSAEQIVRRACTDCHTTPGKKGFNLFEETGAMKQPIPWKRIHTAVSGDPPYMPYTGPKLPAAEVQVLKEKADEVVP